MPTAHVTIHSSQFPENVRRDLLDSLRSRRVNHKFHYDSHRQTQKWLALHQAVAPSRNDADCARVYDAGFAAAAREIPAGGVHLVGLGCGGGQKDARLLRLLRGPGRELSYTPSDVSVAMTLVARNAALAVISADAIHPLVYDLAAADDLRATLDAQSRTGPRLVTFFGMIPNFEPRLILSRLADALRPDDWLLFSANLAPGPDYAVGLKKILPQYDNELTREWLLTFLLDLGVERADGELRFWIEDDPDGLDLQRVAAYFHFARARRVELDGERFEFAAGEAVRLFFSYRHTPDRVRALLQGQGIKVLEEWITASGEEGVFLCKRG